MTDEEFNTWDRHRAENLQRQRDDAVRDLESLQKKYDKEVSDLSERHALDAQSLKDAFTEEIRKIRAEHEDWKIRDAKKRELDLKIAEIERLKAELGD